MDRLEEAAVKLPRAPLEDWLRDYYFTADIDISSSGVEPYTFTEVRSLVGLRADHFEALDFRDSPTCGDPGLRVAIARRWDGGDPARVMVANGSTEILFAVLTTLLRPGDEVVVVEPAYHALCSIASAIGCRLVPWPLRFESGFRPDVDELASLISPATRMVVVNFPHNPTGASLADGMADEIADVAADVGAYLLWDAAFHELTYADPPPARTPTGYERAIVTGTLSKAYGLPGLRVGWCVAPPDVVTGCVTVRDYTTLALSPLVELVALRAVENADALLQPRLAQARRNLGLLEEWIGVHQDRLAWVRPDAGVIAFPRLVDMASTDEFCDRLLHEHGVLLVPGSCFGMSEHVRLGFGGRTDELEQGLALVERALKAA
ncbi:aminotransferase [Virgisporangium aurantiacum]|uniref:Aminotransferase n=2 Tax=Virgisporangium aurantiacum TaxID=175570 RepID=A0A8J4E6E3_9ACTN|nr:aminotransferase [Virgisporangium aurantiacum]